MSEIDAGSWLLSVIGIGVVGHVVFSMKYMLEKQSKRIDKVENDMDESNLIREALKRDYLRQDFHKVICTGTQDKLKLHVSKVAEENRKVMLEAIDKNLEVVTKMLAKLEESLRSNGAMK